MSGSHAARLAWGLWVLGLVLVCGTFVFGALNGNHHLSGLAFIAVELALSTVGALVASRRPGNAIGWLFCGCGVLLALAGFAEEYATRALITAPGSLPAGVGAAWLSSWLEGPIGFGVLPFLLLLFPDGLPSPRWRWAAWTAGVGAALLGVGQALMAGKIVNFKSIENPLGVHGALEGLIGNATALGFGLVVIVMIAAAVSLVRRLRRATGDERQQLKWFASGSALLALTIASGPILWNVAGSVGNPLWSVLFVVSVTALPVATGIGILKYRLYEIDRIVSRTVVYALVSVLLAAAYAGIVLALQEASNQLTHDNSLAIAASTLVVAALFRPLRSRIQQLVDRRFYRRRYDAQRTLEAFSARLRDEVDLNALSRELEHVVSETMQPASFSIWLRAPETLR